MFVYPVADLSPPPACEQPYGLPNIRSLVDAIRTALDDEAYTLQIMPFRDLLVCQCTEPKLEKLDRLLSDLRRT